jgi:hypothetical protein
MGEKHAEKRAEQFLSLSSCTLSSKKGIPTPRYIPGLASSNGISRDRQMFVLLLHFHFHGISPKLDKKIFWRLQESEDF